MRRQPEQRRASSSQKRHTERSDATKSPLPYGSEQGINGCRWVGCPIPGRRSLVGASTKCPSPPESNSHIPALDGLRGLAILLVLLVHTYYPAGGIARHQSTLDRACLHVCGLGWCGVDLFFALSGFLITGILLQAKGGEDALRNFYLRRALRIFPLYYLVVLARLFILPGRAFDPWESTSYLLYFSNFWRSAHLAVTPFDNFVGPTWSLAVEEQFYLLWPLLVFLLSRRSLLILCVVLLGAAPLARW